MQTQFDFQRAEQLGMIERWKCPRLRGVRESTVKHVLRAIDSHGRGREAWPSEATLARETGYCVRTVIRAIQILQSLSLLTIERKGRSTLNHYRIVWSELALRCDNASRRCDIQSQRSDIESKRCDIESKRCDIESKRCDIQSPKTTEKHPEETTTTKSGVVVVELGKVLAKAGKAVQLAKARGLTETEIWERYQRWRELPEPSRLPGTLYNWLALEGSYCEAARPAEPKYGRGDGLSRSEVAAEALRLRIVRAGRAAGASREAIERRLQEVGL